MRAKRQDALAGSCPPGRLRFHATRAFRTSCIDQNFGQHTNMPTGLGGVPRLELNGAVGIGSRGGARMTSLQIADLLHARPVGPSRWMAKCPKHEDRSPSLSIREGQSGRILIRCFAGCTTGDILNKLGLSWADICGEPMTREKIRQGAAERQERELHQKRRRAVERSAFDRLRQLHCISDELGSRLANDPDGPGADDVARLFHEALTKIRRIEVVSR